MKYLSISAINASTAWAVTVTIAIAYDGSYRGLVRAVTYCYPYP